VGNRTGDFDAEKACHTKQESKDTSDSASPRENVPVPSRSIGERVHRRDFSVENDEWEKHDGGANISPPSQLDGRVVAVRKRILDQDGMEGDEERRKNAVKEGKV